MNVHVDGILCGMQTRRSGVVSRCSSFHLDNEGGWTSSTSSGRQLLYLKKRITTREDGILIQPNATYVPKLVAMMKGYERQWKEKEGIGHATLETFNAEFVVGSEMLDGESFDFMTPANSVRRLEMQNFGFTTVLCQF